MSRGIMPSNLTRPYLQSFTNLDGKRIGILGGSFDPVHNGHLTIARAVLSAHSLDNVVFVPAKQNPLKALAVQATDEQRLHMLELAIGDLPDFYISTCELEREGKSYSYLTASDIHDQAPTASLFWIGGFDNLQDRENQKTSLAHWYQKDRFLSLVNFVICTRQTSADISSHSISLKQHILNLDPKLYSEQQKSSLVNHIVEFPPVKASSTAIREMCRGRRYHNIPVPELVRKYLQEQELYRS
jgi:nicotinate-nucleotide adenylyltransferase